MAQYGYYWTSSKFADWLRGTPKPSSASIRGWRDWEKEAKAKHPWRYWLADIGLEHFQDFVTWPARKLYEIKYYIDNRWITRSHALTAHPREIRPGTWHDLGNRFLPCLFNELVNFVEIELAMQHISGADKEVREQYRPPFWTNRWLRWRTWRCPQAGLDNLHWQSNLKFDEEWVGKDDPKIGTPTLQAVSAVEIIALYKWWIEKRPKRLDPMDVSGCNTICERRYEKYKDDDFMWEDHTLAEKQENKQAIDLCNQIEGEYDKEDEAMMIRLIKVRHGLWT